MSNKSSSYSLFPCRLLQVFTNTASALPCELGPDDQVTGAHGSDQRTNKQPKGMLDWLPASKYQMAWAHRIFGAKQLGQQPAEQ